MKSAIDDKKAQDMKEEALAIAKELSTHSYFSLKAVQDARKASDIIFRLVKELDKQEYRNKHEGFSTIIDKVAPQTKPLSDEEIEKIYEESYLPIGSQEWEFDCIVFARAIEERHGIK